MKTRIVLALLALCTLAACGPNDAPNDGKADQPSTVSPTVEAETGFDPCKDINDASLLRAGLNPQSRKPSQAAQAFKYEGCEYQSRDKIVSIIVSVDTTFQEQRDRFSATGNLAPTNGRPTVIAQNEISHNDTCVIIFQIGEGVVFIGQTIKSDALFAGMQGCDGAEQIANAIEPSLPKGN